MSAAKYLYGAQIRYSMTSKCKFKFILCLEKSKTPTGFWLLNLNSIGPSENDKIT